MLRKVGLLKAILISTICLLITIILLSHNENNSIDPKLEPEPKELQAKKEIGSDLNDVLSDLPDVFKHQFQSQQQQSVYSKGQAGSNPQHTTKADSVKSLANYSSEFRSSFCNHTLKPVPTTPIMCIFDPKVDQYISKMVEKGAIWDKRGVATVLTHLVHLQKDIAERGQDPINQLLFLDLGANIGTFTLPALSYGVPTISVEPLPIAMERLASSIDMNNFQPPTSLPYPSSLPLSPKRSPLSTLHRKAISDKQGCVESKENALNKGGSEVVQVECDGKGSDDDRVLRSVTVDDLVANVSPNEATINVVIKMDVQGFEPYALKGASSLLFDNRFNVSLIYMEWAEMRNSLAKCSKQKQLARNRSSNQSVQNHEVSGRGLIPADLEELKPQQNFCELIDATTGMLVHRKGYQVYSKENGRELHWENRHEWTDNIFLTQPPTQFRVEDKIPNPFIRANTKSQHSQL